MTRTFNKPTLPFSDDYDFTDSLQSNDTDAIRVAPPVVIHDGRLEHDYPRGPVPGPAIPRSWSGLFRHGDNRSTVAFRREALSLILAHLRWSFGSSDVPTLGTRDDYSPEPESDTATEVSDDAPDTSTHAVPPLTQIALGVLLQAFPDAESFRDELLPMLPPHFRRDVLRYTAVHDPLPNTKLYALCAPEGHADGELFVVGPQASVLREPLVGLSPTLAAHRAIREEDEDTEAGAGADGQTSRDRGEGGSGRPGFAADAVGGASDEMVSPTDDQGESWDALSDEDEDEVPPLHAFVVLSAVVSPSALFVFPCTLTHLALLALPIPSPVHRLPRICPLLEVLDLSYNLWLNDPPGTRTMSNTESTVERIEWAKWSNLRVLGLRGCGITIDIVTKVNKGRWDDVEVVGLNSDGMLVTEHEDVKMRNLHLTD